MFKDIPFRIARRLRRSASNKVIRVINKRKGGSQRDILKRLSQIPHWEDKISAYSELSYSQRSGQWIAKGENDAPAQTTVQTKGIKVNYGCGGTIIPGWLNVDLFDLDNPDFMRVNLLEKHPFEDGSVAVGYSEDMIEHLQQAERIFFLSEVYRSLEPGGVVRLSFPGLEGVLKRHYTPPTELRVRQGEFEAYSFWDHIHFYSKEEISLVTRHLGFGAVDFFEYGLSPHHELRERDTRAHQIDLNTFVELTK